jgi:hypothetical protein
VLLVCLRPEPAEPAQVKIRIKVQINGAWNFSHSAVNHKYIISSPRNHCRNIAGVSSAPIKLTGQVSPDELISPLLSMPAILI